MLKVKVSIDKIFGRDEMRELNVENVSMSHTTLGVEGNWNVSHPTSIISPCCFHDKKNPFNASTKSPTTTKESHLAISLRA